MNKKICLAGAIGVLLLSLGGYLLYDKVGNKSNAEGSAFKISDNGSIWVGKCGMTDP